MLGKMGLALVVARLAAADPAPKAACKPAGGVLFEVAQRAERKARLPTATTRLYENGAWKTEVIDIDGKLARTEAGCLKPLALDDIRERLRLSTWKTTRSTATCRADQPRFTTYTWKRRLLYTERTCNVDVLDKDSRHVLDVIETHLGIDVEWLDRGRGSSECANNPLCKRSR